MQTENTFANWIKERGIGEVECLIPDLNGVIRGKVFPAPKFLQSERDGSLRIPSSVYSLTVTGEYSDDADESIAMKDPDVVLRPDIDTICVAPGYKTPTAFVFADAYHTDGNPFDIAPRYVLKKVVELYDKMGLKPVVAPELEFYLTQINTDPDLPLAPPAGRSGRSETAKIDFRKGDRWSYLAYLAEGSILIRYADKNYIAGDGQDLIEKSTEIEASKDAGRSDYDEWLGLKCANGKIGWILLNEIKDVPSLSEPNIVEYGVARDKR